MVPDRSHGVHWRVVATVIGLAVASTALWIGLQPRYPNIPANEDLQGQDPAYRAGGPECEPQWLAGLSGRYADGIRQACAEAAEEHRLKTNDLVQQTRSAVSAEAVVMLTYDQSRIALIGLLLTLWAFAAAAAAAVYARKAADETERTADTAIAGLELSSEDTSSPNTSISARPLSLTPASIGTMRPTLLCLNSLQEYGERPGDHCSLFPQQAAD